MPENRLANAAITDMQMRQRDAAGSRCKKYTKELADAKAENDAHDDVAAGRRRLHIKAVCQSCVKLPPLPAVIMQPPRLADTAERGLPSPSERG